jgi:ubiquinone/menaquinone biosynthesis C-methylase UbiE
VDSSGELIAVKADGEGALDLGCGSGECEASLCRRDGNEGETLRLEPGGDSG